MPSTPKVVVTNSPTSGMVSCGKIDGFKLFSVLTSMETKAFAFFPHFWAVRGTNDKERANMELVHIIDENKSNNQIRITIMKNLKEIERKKHCSVMCPRRLQRPWKIWLWFRQPNIVVLANNRRIVSMLSPA